MWRIPNGSGSTMEFLFVLAFDCCSPMTYRNTPKLKKLTEIPRKGYAESQKKSTALISILENRPDFA